MDDDQLLRRYATHRSEAAFRELVQRHIAVVQGVARRQAGIDAHLADDVTQRVFVTLARKADAFSAQTTLVGWLYTAARLEAARAARTEARRRNWEEKSAEQNPMPNEETPVSWEHLRPVLDEAMAHLGETDRTAVLLRFFSGRSFAEVGRVFQISEDAARKRVDRAIEKLREILERRGIASTALALGTALGAHAAPSVTSEALATIAAGAWQQASVTPALQFGIYMSSTKVTLAVTGAVLLLAATAVIRDAATLRHAETIHAVAASELAALRERSENTRRELAAVQRQKAEADARERALIATTENPRRPYLQDPAYRALARTASQMRRHLEFQRFYRALALSPDQIERFEQIMVRQDQAVLDGQVARDLGRDEQAVFRSSGPEWSSAMKALLGENGLAQLQDYLRSMAVRNFIDAIAAKSYESGEPITLAQAERLTALALVHDSLYQQGKGTDPGKVRWNEVWEPAAKFLAPQQVVTFETAVEVWSLQKRLSLAAKAAPTP